MAGIIYINNCNIMTKENQVKTIRVLSGLIVRPNSRGESFPYL